MENMWRKRRIKPPWVWEDTLKLCYRQRKKKAKPFDGEVQAKEYKSTNILVRRELKKAKEVWIMKQCETMQAYVKRNNTKLKILKFLGRFYDERPFPFMVLDTSTLVPSRCPLESAPLTDIGVSYKCSLF